MNKFDLIEKMVDQGYDMMEIVDELDCDIFDVYQVIDEL